MQNEDLFDVWNQQRAFKFIFFLIWAKIEGRGGGCTAIYANNRYIYPYMDEECRPLVWDRVLFMWNLSVVWILEFPVLAGYERNLCG